MGGGEVTNRFLLCFEIESAVCITKTSLTVLHLGLIFGVFRLNTGGKMPESRRGLAVFKGGGSHFSRVRAIVFIGATLNGPLFSVFSDVFISPAPTAVPNRVCVHCGGSLRLSGRLMSASEIWHVEPRKKKSQRLCNSVIWFLFAAEPL